jgi:ADP-L-glycero-D-manno-heptose 6-epimerase
MEWDPTIVVTGGAGFIGSCLLKSLLTFNSATRLLAVDHPLTGSKRRIISQYPDIPFMQHDRFLVSLQEHRLRPRIILHMGACSSTTESNEAYLEENNLRYSQRLFSWCARNEARLIYASSAATYGDGELGFNDESPIDALKPLNLYGKSKHHFDIWVETQKATGQPVPPQCVGLKFFNVFGPGESQKQRMASMVYHGWNQIRETGRIQLFQSHRSDFSHGGQLRDFVYVKDIVWVMLQILQRPEVNGLFNLGTGIARSFNDLALATFAAFGISPRIEYIPMPLDLQGRYQYYTQAHMMKLRNAGICYKPTSLEEAISDYVRILQRAQV